jgi:hypothetical protein
LRLSIIALVSTFLLAIGSASECLAADNRDGNFSSCLSGYLCDENLLTQAEKQRVKEASLSRNFQYCLAGYLCDENLLTYSERQKVWEAQLSRNYSSCLSGYGCDESLLTEDQKAAIQSRQAASEVACAENGSCYGDISEQTGRPKTVKVKGYYRKDGTYVRGHYRSRPRR